MVGESSFLWGLQIKQTNNGVFISQTKYAWNLLKKFGLNSPKHTQTPINVTAKISVDSNGKDVDSTLYQSIVGSLLYLAASRPDIAYGAHYQSKPKESYIIPLKEFLSTKWDNWIWYLDDS